MESHHSLIQIFIITMKRHNFHEKYLLHRKRKIIFWFLAFFESLLILSILHRVFLLVLYIGLQQLVRSLLLPNKEHENSELD